MGAAYLVFRFFEELFVDLPALHAQLDPLWLATTKRALLALPSIRAVRVFEPRDLQKQPHLLQDELGLLDALHRGIRLDLEVRQKVGGSDEGISWRRRFRRRIVIQRFMVVGE